MACSHSHARPSAGGLTSNSSNSKNRPESGGIAPEQCNSKAVSGAELAAQLGTRPPAPLDPYPILRLGSLNLEHLYEQFGFTVFRNLASQFDFNAPPDTGTSTGRNAARHSLRLWGFRLAGDPDLPSVAWPHPASRHSVANIQAPSVNNKTAESRTSARPDPNSLRVNKCPTCSRAANVHFWHSVFWWNHIWGLLEPWHQRGWFESCRWATLVGAVEPVGCFK